MAICPCNVPVAMTLRLLLGGKAMHSTEPSACTEPTGPLLVQNTILPEEKIGNF